MLKSVPVNFWKPAGMVAEGVVGVAVTPGVFEPLFEPLVVLLGFLLVSASAATTPPTITTTRMIEMSAIKPPFPFLGAGAIGPPGNPGGG